MTKVSVIIPAYNEEDGIQATIEALQKNKALDIIVVDNGSTDSTADIVKNLGIKVFSLPEATIAAVRNHGVLKSGGEVLVFIDADVRVASEWHKNLPLVIEELIQNEMLVTGSRCLPAESNNLIIKYWYSKLANYQATYINSGHLITTRALFEKVKGFSENLETAEDYDFCHKAITIGAEIRNNRELPVIHDGYPKSLWGFIRREKWHGQQDVSTWPAFLESKIAWIAALNLALLLCAIIASFAGIIMALPGYLVVMYLVSIMLSIVKFGVNRIDSFFITPIFFFLYLCGRALSIIDRLLVVVLR